MTRVTREKATSKKDRDALSSGYTWYVNTLDEQKGIDGAKVKAKKKVLSIKYLDQFIIYFK